MEEVWYIAETMARTHRQETAEEGHAQALMQGRKKLKRREGRRREGERMDDDDEDEGEEARPSTSSAVPESSAASGERNARHDPVPREEHLTEKLQSEYGGKTPRPSGLGQDLGDQRYRGAAHHAEPMG